MGKKKKNRRIKISRAFGSAHDDESETEVEVANEEDNMTAVAKSDDSIEELEGSEVVEALKAEVQENHEKYLRALADFENFKRHATKQRADLLKYQGEAIFLSLLDIVDNFERALDAKQSDAEQLRAGLEIIYNQLVELMSRHEVRGDSAVGQKFDPQMHEALSIAPTSEVEPGVVLDQLKKAYFYKDKLLRPAQVVVAAEPASKETEEQAEDSRTSEQ